MQQGALHARRAPAGSAGLPILLAVLLALAATLAVAAPAAAAVTVGSDLAREPNNAISCGGSSSQRGCVLVQRYLTNAVERVPFDGVITRWRFRNKAAEIPDWVASTVRFRVVRSPDWPAFYFISESEPATIPTASGVVSSPTRLSVRKGDFIGAEIGQASRAFYALHQGPGAEMLNFTDQPVGTSGTPSRYENFELLVNADVEPDIDVDGYGDETQDDDDDADGVADASDNCTALANRDQANSDDDPLGDACDGDDDGDGVADGADNCRTAANPGQSDADGDAAGDACDADDDDDAVLDGADNCRTAPNPGQINTDGDADGDACDADDDNDAVADGSDNCALVANPGQSNSDTDPAGDACDADDDNDGALDGNDAFPTDPAEQRDADADGTGDNADPDDDNDAVADGTDNCRTVANPQQANLDGDAAGDACDPDDDGDAVADGTDNCPRLGNAGQENADADDAGDACDADDDNDQLLDAQDNCSLAANPAQTDSDGDAAGDACDADDDNDTIGDGADNCRLIGNPAQTNTDGDATGDACDPDDDGDQIADGADNCSLAPNADQADADGDAQGDACDSDDDGDGAADASDNCPATANGEQLDADGDGQGNACDADDDNDGVADTAESAAGTDPLRSDSDGDGRSDGADNCPRQSNGDQADFDADRRGDACDPPPPPCASSSAARYEFDDTIGDAQNLAPDYFTIYGDVTEACSLRLTLGLDSNTLIAGDSLLLFIDSDGDPTTGDPKNHGAERYIFVGGSNTTERPGIMAKWNAATGDYDYAQGEIATEYYGSHLIILTLPFADLGLYPDRELHLRAGSLYRGVSGTIYSDFAPNLGQAPYAFRVSYRGPIPTAEPTLEPPAPLAQAPLGPALQAPRNSSPPRVLGKPRPGRVVRCTTGDWSGTAPLRYRYQWLRNGKPIRGANTPRYKLTRRDRRGRLSCRVTAANAAGKASASTRRVRVSARAARAATPARALAALSAVG